MGGNESKESDSKSSIHFSDEEKPMVSTLFHRISHGKKTFNREEFRVSSNYGSVHVCSDHSKPQNTDG